MRAASEKLLYALANIDDEFVEEAQRAYEAGELPLHRHTGYAKYLAIAAALAFVLLGAARPTVLVEAAQAVMQWFEDHVSYRFRSDTGLESIHKYGLCDLGEGYRLLDEEYQGSLGFATWYFEDKEQSIYFLYGLSDGEVQVLGADLDYQLVTDTDGTELHYIFPEESGQEASLTWVSEDGQIVFSISGNLSEEELLELRHHVQDMGAGVAESSEAASAHGFDVILAGLTEEQAYAVWHSESECPILLVAEMGTYEIDGVNASIYCQVYGLQDGVPKYLGEIAGGGTAYPFRWDEEYIYVEWQHAIARYGIAEQSGTLRLSDGLCYIPSEEGYRVRRDTAVEEVFDENGESKFFSEGEWLDEESGEEVFLQLGEDAAEAEIINFVAYTEEHAN
ncbi:MAG: hypothetical protein NC092_07595 [Butyrivibrio sp.]|nr:hypothetical protein [Muribaculum sp.]MCM1552536.1 hypothetical protein [Butyrivibrio sp.]